ncbi:blast:Aspartyl/asparaginyl beta-hydroxylase [Drosophila guanche]|uniref:Blast:Aspartyl/asparaginyl beta-hydroxylase n=1 Tax=Drosophila guanche TaxID=7266 RepID=A0A3B0JL45_DROGU|nr:blast:Aspartyl/asparaginyl beta-hydroxylase [Drosophila guanche]
MSGDVQPRKRKDKRRKRDDDESSHGVHITKMGNDDVHLHVHHDHGTGGNWCAKIIFFSLMAVLLGLVGLIILENRGLEDMDTPLSESRFSNYFNGLVDEHRGEHDAHDVHKPSGEALDEHDDHDEHDEHDDHDEEEEPLSEELEEEDEEEEEEEEEEDVPEEVAETEQEEETEQEDKTEQDEDEDEDEEEVEEEEEQKEDDDEEEEDNNAGENITAEEPEEDELDDDNTAEPSVEATAEATVEATAEYDVEDPDEDEPDDDAEDDVPESEEPAPTTAELDEDKTAEHDEAEEEEIKESVQWKAQSSPKKVTTKYYKDNEDDEKKYDDDDDDFESLDEDPEELARQVRRANAADSEEQQQDNNEEEPKEEGSSWLASLAVKFGVGVALALVSRLVLNRKSPNTTEDEPPPPEAIMRRRLTIATDEDQIPDDLEEIPLLDDEYSEEEIEIEEEIEVEISDIEEEDAGASSGDCDVALSASYVPETFEQLSSMYKSSPEPPNETKPQEPKETEEPLKPSGFSDLYVEYEDGAIEDYEHDGETDEEDEITDEEEDEISDVDDADLMSRLEAKYGRLPVKEFESDPDSDDPTWTQIKPKEVPASAPASTPAPAAEDSFQQELRKANAEIIRENYVQALRSFNTLIQHYADEPLAHLGHARLLERLAEKERSNQRLWQAIDAYKRYLAFGELVASDGEFLSAGERCIQHLRFMGYHQQSVNIHELLIERLPADPRLRNQLSFTHLTANNMRQVKLVAAETLKLWPDDPVAQLHFGLAIKQLHGDYEQALPYLQNAIESKAEGTQEGYFYLALGETLQRLYRQQEAVEVHRQGVARGLIPSVYQRSLYNEPQLRAQPFWQPSETGYASQLRKLQENWMSIREEALSLLSHRGYFADETENLRHKGIWQQFELFAKGQLHGKNCQRAPITCGLMKAFPESSGCRRGQVKFSVMQAETHVWPHCGPTNCRLRAHLTLVAPEPEQTSLRVAEREITWREGELIIFDDSFEHEVWHNGTRPRLVLIIDMWHPDLTATQRRTLTAI